MLKVQDVKKRTEIVESTFAKIVSDIAYAPPEMWPHTREKIRARLASMAAWLAEEVDQ